MIDADHFKSVNDRFGHLVGDRVLITLAALLQSNLRKSDVVARYGGEEFVVLVAGISSQPQVLYIAEKLRAAVQAVQFHPQIDVTISVGVAVSGRGLSGPALLHAADEALYDAKREGRNRVTLSQADPTDIERRGRFES
jgi:diguanylate cyclase (GGDEF)-like protein